MASFIRAFFRPNICSACGEPPPCFLCNLNVKESTSQSAEMKYGRKTNRKFVREIFDHVIFVIK